jgi:hypothetical protein
MAASVPMPTTVPITRKPIAASPTQKAVSPAQRGRRPPVVRRMSLRQNCPSVGAFAITSTCPSVATGM